MQEPEHIQTDPLQGLTQAQVQARMAAGKSNVQPPPITKSTGHILREHICTFFNALNLLIFVALLLVDSYSNLLFMGIVLSNLLIGIIQEIRSKRMVERLSLLHAPHARAVREGEVEQVALDQVVLDDILILKLGDQIPTDCVLAAGNVEVNESLLTGEPNAIAKKVGDEVLSGSVVVSGECRARVVRVGVEGYAASLAMEAKKPRRIHSELMRSLRRIIQFSGTVVLPLGLTICLRAYLQHGHSIKLAVEQAAGSMLGMIPSGLMLLTSVSLAVGVITLSRKHALVQETYCIETLARTDVLCLDKTGTLTTGNMQVAHMQPLGDRQAAQIESMLAEFVAAVPAYNATSSALLARYYTPDEAKQAPLGIIPFHSGRRFSAAAFATYTLYVGAPETVCGHCMEEIEAQVDAFSKQGYRVLVFAVGGPQAGEPLLPEQARPAPAALLLVADEIRPEAAKTLRFFEEEHVTIRILSGDDARTVAQIAKRLELAGSERYIDVSTLESEAAIEEAALQYTVFGRVSPHEKRLLLRAMQRAGHTVAMTGDGVNDLLALRDADCSIALHTGSDAARQVAHLVLLTDDFSVLPEVVMEGRRVVNNITRTASLFLVKTLFSLFISVCSVAFGMVYPFQPIQLSLVSALTVGVPSFFLALEPSRARIKGSFLKNVLVKAVPGAFMVFTYAVLSGMIGKRLGFDMMEINTLTVYLAGTASLFVLLRVCLPLERRRGLLFFSVAAAFFIAATLFGDFFKLDWLRGGTMLAVYLIMAAFCPLLLALLEKLLRKLLRADKIKQRKRKIR